jgi:membrane protein
VLFALIDRFLPDTRVDWRDVWIGALVTALLFAIGQSAIGLYLSHAGIASAYGAAGSLLALLVWVYYSALILLFGAAFTSVNAERRARATSGPRPSRSPAASSTSARTAAPGGRY